MLFTRSIQSYIQTVLNQRSAGNSYWETDYYLKELGVNNDCLASPRKHALPPLPTIGGHFRLLRYWPAIRKLMIWPAYRQYVSEQRIVVMDLVKPLPDVYPLVKSPDPDGKIRAVSSQEMRRASFLPIMPISRRPRDRPKFKSKEAPTYKL